METESVENMDDQVLDAETLGRSDAVRELFGERYEKARGYAQMLMDQGELRGLIGPREVPRLWERHILNSAAVVPYLAEARSVADVGSGAGLPGVVVAIMRPDAEVFLVEPMERRTTWLDEVVAEIGLTNVEVKRGRAEEFHDAFEVDAVTSRAVAARRRRGWPRRTASPPWPRPGCTEARCWMPSS
jgi:16S rRNA (guanine527-N7)-methyltransferase